MKINMGVFRQNAVATHNAFCFGVNGALIAKYGWVTRNLRFH